MIIANLLKISKESDIISVTEKDTKFHQIKVW